MHERLLLAQHEPEPAHRPRANPRLRSERSSFAPGQQEDRSAIDGGASRPKRRDGYAGGTRNRQDREPTIRSVIVAGPQNPESERTFGRVHPPDRLVEVRSE